MGSPRTGPGILSVTNNINESTKVRNQSTGKYTEIWPTSRFGSKVACYPLMLRGIALSSLCALRKWLNEFILPY